METESSDRWVLAGVFLVFIAIAGLVTFTSTGGIQGLAVADQKETVWVDIIAQNVQHLHSVDLAVAYGSDEAAFVSAEAGPFLSSDGAEVFVPTKSTIREQGVVHRVYLVRLSDSGVSGSGVIATLEFTASSRDHDVQLLSATLVTKDLQELPASALRTEVRTTYSKEEEEEVRPQILESEPSGTLPRGTTSTTLTVTTDRNAVCRQATASGLPFSRMQDFSTTQGTAHEHPVSGLEGGASYTYYVRCQDVAKSGMTSEHAISFSVERTPPSQLGRDGDANDGSDTDRPSQRRGQARVFGTSTTLAEDIDPSVFGLGGTQLGVAQRVSGTIWSVIVVVFIVSMLAVVSLSKRPKKNPEIVRLRKQQQKRKK